MKDKEIRLRISQQEKAQVKKTARKKGFKNMSAYIYYLLHQSMKIMVLFIPIVLLGCTTAGPFVTNISSDGKGGINIEKARVKQNFWTGGLETAETTQEHIQLYQKTE